jgi:hypothetical protein
MCSNQTQFFPADWLAKFNRATFAAISEQFPPHACPTQSSLTSSVLQNSPPLRNDENLNAPQSTALVTEFNVWPIAALQTHIDSELRRRSCL